MQTCDEDSGIIMCPRINRTPRNPNSWWRSDSKEEIKRQIKTDLGWTDNDDESFYKYMSFDAVLRLNSTNSCKYLCNLTHFDLEDKYKEKWIIAVDLYGKLNNLVTKNDTEYSLVQLKITKLFKMMAYIL
jgi:hypothetical protein